MILRQWFWLGLILALLWAPVIIIEKWIDPPSDWVTKTVRPDQSRRQR